MPLDNAITTWYQRKLAAGYHVRSLRKIGKHFMEVTESSHAHDLTRIAFLHQNSVLSIPIIPYQGVLYTLLVEEYREGAAQALRGFPIVSLHVKESHLFESAKRSLLERAPLHASWLQKFRAIDLGTGSYAAPGSTNEQLFLVLVDVALPANFDIQNLHGVSYGDYRKNELIQSYITPLEKDLFYHLPSIGHKLALLLALQIKRSS